MNSKKGMSKIAVVLIVLFILILIGAGTFFAIWFIEKNNKPQVEVELYEEYTEGEAFVDNDFYVTEYTPLAKGLTEYKNEELGVRFGYLTGLELPEDETLADGTYVSTMKSETKSTQVQFRVGKIDESQSDIDYIKKQKESLTEELIKAETKIVEEEVDGKIVQKTIVPEKVSDINVSYSLIAKQLAVKFTYTENDLKCTRILTIKDSLVYSLTYKAADEEYKGSEEDAVLKSFEFITKIDDSAKGDLSKLEINGKEYSLPIKVSYLEGLLIDDKYAVQHMTPNYFTIVSLYENEEPKYSAYVYNAKASVDEIGHGYVTAISTDVNRGGNIRIYKGIEMGIPYSKVRELIGTPSTYYYSDDKTVMTAIYQIDNTTIQLKFRNDDLSRADENAKVVSILVKVAR